MFDDLLNAFYQREQLRKQITNLKQLMQNGEVSDEEYTHLNKEYKQHLQIAESTIHDIRSKVHSNLTIAKATLDAYEGQVHKIQDAYKKGALSEKEYSKQVDKIFQERAKWAQGQHLEQQQAMLKAKSAAELESLAASVKNPAAQYQKLVSSPKSWFDTVLKTFIAIVVLVLLVTLIFPFFPDSIEPHISGGNSLFTAARELRTLHPAFLSLVLGPAIFGIVALLTTLLNWRRVRGFLLLLVSTVGLTALSTGIGALMFYPHPMLSEATALLTSELLSSSGIVPAIFLGCFGIVHILALLHIINSRAGWIFWIASTALVIVVGVITGVICAFTTHVSPQITLAEEQVDLETATMRIGISNRGNVPLYLTNIFGNHPSRNTYIVALTMLGEDNTKTLVESTEPLFSAFGYLEVAPGEVKKVTGQIPWTLEKQSAQEQAGNVVLTTTKNTGTETVVNELVLRAALHSGDGTIVHSEEITVKRPAPEPEPEIAPLPTSEDKTDGEQGREPAQQNRRDPQSEAALKEIQRITTRLGNTKTAVLNESIADTQGLINSLLDERERQRLHDLLDTAILTAKEREASEYYDQAVQAYQAGYYERASSLCKELQDLFEDAPKPFAKEYSEKAITLNTNAGQLMQQAQIALDPRKQYQMTGIVQTPEGKKAAFLMDRITGNRIRVIEGDLVNGWKVVAIDNEFLRLQKDREECMLTVKGS